MQKRANILFWLILALVALSLFPATVESHSRYGPGPDDYHVTRHALFSGWGAPAAVFGITALFAAGFHALSLGNKSCVATVAFCVLTLLFGCSFLPSGNTLAIISMSGFGLATLLGMFCCMEKGWKKLQEIETVEKQAEEAQEKENQNGSV